MSEESKFGPVRVYLEFDGSLPGAQVEGSWVDAEMPVAEHMVDIQIINMKALPSLYRNPEVIKHDEDNLFEVDYMIKYQYYWERKFLVINNLQEILDVLFNHKDLILYCQPGGDFVLEANQEIDVTCC